MDDLDLFTHPACPHCGTVLRDGRRGWICHTCRLSFLPEEWPASRVLSEGDE